MANSVRTKKKKPTSRKSRRSQGVPLNPEQIRSLAKIWHDYPGGDRAFAARIEKREHPKTTDSTRKNIENVVKYLRRVENGEQGIAHWRFKTIAEVLKTKTDILINRLSLSNATDSVPWVTENDTLKEYRLVYHCYYQTKQGDDIYWIYSPVDFTKPYSGYLRASVRITVNVAFDYKVYGYLFRKMFVMVSKCDEKGNEKDAIHVYYDFRNRARDPEGHFGIFMNEDWDDFFGVGGSLLFKKPFPNAESPGRQSPAVCEALSKHWKVLDGQRCNRMLHLFGHPPYSRPPADWAKLRNTFGDKPRGV
jgi:hypothetical protein